MMKKEILVAWHIVAIISLLSASSLIGVAQSPQEKGLVQITADEYQRSIQGMADRLLYLYDNMPTVRVFIADRDEFSRSNPIPALAVFVSNYDGREAILVNPQHIGLDFKEMHDTVKHELIHCWLFRKHINEGGIYGGHGEAFIRKAIELKVDLSGVFHSFPDTKKIYDRLLAEHRTRQSPQVPSSGNGSSLLGPDMYEFTFMPYRSEVRLKYVFKMDPPPGRGIVYKWREKQWQVYNVSGTSVLLKEVLRIAAIVNRTRYEVNFEFWDNFGVQQLKTLGPSQSWYSSKPNADIVVKFDSRPGGGGQKKQEVLTYKTCCDERNSTQLIELTKTCRPESQLLSWRHEAQNFRPQN